jgi:HemY protein
MLRVLWFAIKVGVLVALAVWVANRPGEITVHWMDYTVNSKAWFALLAVLAALFVILLLHRVLLSILGFTGAIGRYREWRMNKKGQRAILLGLTAVAAGDKKLAAYQAHRARKFLPKDQGLTLLLEADAARLQGDTAKAQAAYTALLENKDTAFLGLRGLLSSALERGQNEEALVLARRALSTHPKQDWLLRLAYRLEIMLRDWEGAGRTLRRIEKQRAFPADTVKRDRQALLLQQASEDFDNAQHRVGAERLKQAYRLDPAFVPAALALADHYIQTGQRRAAVKLIGRSWSLAPHPELAELWGRLAPAPRSGEPSIRVRWFEKLVALRPDSDESQLAAAGAAIEDRLWGEARQYLAMAESIRVSRRLYALRARMEERLSHPSEARHWQDKAANAPAEPGWVCRETGQVYERWTPLAEPHGAFNSIVWDVPQGKRERAGELALPAENAMLPRLRA